MGGFGSGHRGFHQKARTVETCLDLDTNRWAQQGILKAGVVQTGTAEWTYPSGHSARIDFAVDTTTEESRHVRLRYRLVSTATDETESPDYHVPLVTTCPHFGGLRWWFLCPLSANEVPCGRRVGKLYLPPGARYFGCRHCHRLTYRSCQESGRFRDVYRLVAAMTGQDPADVGRSLRRLARAAPRVR
jgi:hypothetical protein